MIVGPAWEIAGKVVDVDDAGILATVEVSASTVSALPAQTLKVRAVQETLVPTESRFGWRFDSLDDQRRLLVTVMTELAAEIAGPEQHPDEVPPKN